MSSQTNIDRNAETRRSDMTRQDREGRENLIGSIHKVSGANPFSPLKSSWIAELCDLSPSSSLLFFSLPFSSQPFNHSIIHSSSSDLFYILSSLLVRFFLFFAICLYFYTRLLLILRALHNSSLAYIPAIIAIIVIIAIIAIITAPDCSIYPHPPLPPPSHCPFDISPLW